MIKELLMLRKLKKVLSVNLADSMVAIHIADCTHGPRDPKKYPDSLRYTVEYQRVARRNLGLNELTGLAR